MENNPVKTKNINNLTSSQFSKLVSGIKDKKFRVVSWQGTILMDLLEYAQQLIAQGNTNQQTNAHKTYLQELVKQASPQKVKVESTTPKNSQIPAKNPNTNTYLLVGGLVLLIVSVLAIGYWLGKRKSQPNFAQ